MSKKSPTWTKQLNVLNHATIYCDVWDLHKSESAYHPRNVWPLQAGVSKWERAMLLTFGMRCIIEPRREKTCLSHMRIPSRQVWVLSGRKSRRQVFLWRGSYGMSSLISHASFPFPFGALGRMWSLSALSLNVCSLQGYSPNNIAIQFVLHENYCGVIRSIPVHIEQIEYQWFVLPL